MKFLFLGLFLSFQSYANEEVIFPDGEVIVDLNDSNIDQFIEEGPIVPMRSFSKSGLSELQKLEKFNRKKELPRPKLKVRFAYEDPNSTIRPYLAVLRKNSRIQKIEDESVYTLKKAIYVKAILTGPESPYSYILDKENGRRYLTLTTNLSSIEGITSMLPTNDYKINHSVNKVPVASNYFFNTDHHLQISLEKKDINYFSNNIATLEDTQVNARSLKYKMYVDTTIPLKIGATISIQGNEFLQTDASWNSFFYGLSAKYSFDLNPSWTISPSIEAGRSLYDNLKINHNSNTTNFNLSTAYWSLGIDTQFHSDYGTFFVGLSYTSYRSSVKNYDDMDINFNSNKFSNDGMAIVFGHIFEIEI